MWSLWPVVFPKALSSAPCYSACTCWSFCFFLVCIYSKIILPVEKTVLLTCTSDSKPFTTAGSFQQNAFIINPPTRFLLQHVKLSVQLLPFKVTSNINNVNYIIAVDVINLVYFYYLYYWSINNWMMLKYCKALNSLALRTEICRKKGHIQRRYHCVKVYIYSSRVWANITVMVSLLQKK